MSMSPQHIKGISYMYICLILFCHPSAKTFLTFSLNLLGQVDRPLQMSFYLEIKTLQQDYCHFQCKLDYCPFWCKSKAENSKVVNFFTYWLNFLPSYFSFVTKKDRHNIEYHIVYCCIIWNPFLGFAEVSLVIKNRVTVLDVMHT